MPKKSLPHVLSLSPKGKKKNARRQQLEAKTLVSLTLESKERVRLLPPRSEGEESQAPVTARLPAKHHSGCSDRLSRGRSAWRLSALPTSPSVWSDQHHLSASPPPPAAPSGSSSAGAEPRSILGSAASARGGVTVRRSGGLWQPSAASSPCRRLCPAPFPGAADQPLPGDRQRMGFLAGDGCSEPGRLLDFLKNSSGVSGAESH